MKYIFDNGKFVDFEDIRKHFLTKRRTEFVDALQNSEKIIKDIKSLKDSAEFQAVEKIDTNDLSSIEMKEIDIVREKLERFNSLVKAVNMGSSSVVGVDFSLKPGKYHVKSDILKDANFAEVVISPLVESAYDEINGHEKIEKNIFSNEVNGFAVQDSFIAKIQKLEDSSFLKNNIVQSESVREIIDVVCEKDANAVHRAQVASDFDMLMELLAIAEAGKYQTLERVGLQSDYVEHALSDEAHKKLKRLVAQAYSSLKTKEELSSQSKKGDDFGSLFNSQSVAGKGFDKAENQKEID